MSSSTSDGNEGLAETPPALPTQEANNVVPGATGVNQPTPSQELPSIMQPSSTINAGARPGQNDLAGAQQSGGSSLAPSTIAENPSVANGAASSSSGGSNLSNGAVAGVAIATLLIGAALAFLAAFFFFKRRNKNRDGHGGAAGYTPYRDSSPELVMVQKGIGGRNSPYVQVSQTPLPAPMPVPAPAPVQQPSPPDVIAGILPAAAHENEVQNRVAALIKQIHCHVETYYRDVHATLTPSMKPELARFGAKGVNMAELLQDCSSPTTAIKHALAVYVLGITGPKRGEETEEGETVFPEELQDKRLQNITGFDPKLITASTLHRRLSVYIFTATSSLSNPRRSWHAQSDIREAAEHFSLTFFPWANPAGDDQDKDEDLARIVSEALETHIWLFGQPFLFEFRWDGIGQRGVMISPELVRRADEDGERDARLVLESGVAAL